MIRPPVRGQGRAQVGAFLLWATVGVAGTGAACAPPRAVPAAPPPPVTARTPRTTLPPAEPGSTGGEAPSAMQDSLPGELAARTLAGGTRLVFYREPEPALVAVRLSFPLSSAEGPPQALARIAQGLTREELERAAAFYGARAVLEQSATEASFAITGAASDFPQLVGILRHAITWGGWTARAVATARLVAATGARRDEETPEPLLRRRLAAQLFSELPPAADSVPPKLTPITLQRFWASSFRPAHMHAVVVGAVEEAQALAALSAWPNPATPSAPPPPLAHPTRRGAVADSAGGPMGVKGAAAGASPGEGPQVLFPWAAIAWRTEADPATVAVVARLLRLRLMAEPLRNARAELWWSRGQRALVALGSATVPADSSAPALSATLDAAVRDVVRAVTPAEVAAARQAVAREILFSGRTPGGLARYLGELFDRTGDPLAGQAFLRALDRVSAHSVEAAVNGLARPVTAEVLP